MFTTLHVVFTKLRIHLNSEDFTTFIISLDVYNDVGRAIGFQFHATRRLSSGSTARIIDVVGGLANACGPVRVSGNFVEDGFGGES